jgi:hypothetical protein
MQRGSQFSSCRYPLRKAAVLFVLAGCALLRGQDAQETPPTYSLHGTVVNRLTHQPVPRALVQFADKAALTDRDGRFEFTGLPSMGSVIQVKKPGFLDPNTQPQLAEPWQSGITVGPDTPDLSLSITPEAIITGQITLPSTEPAESVYVALHRRSFQDGRPMWAQSNGANTNSKGIFRFADLAPGTYYLSTQPTMDTDGANILSTEVNGHGFPPVYYGSGLEFSTASQFTLTAGQHFQGDMNLVREQFHKVTAIATNMLPGESIQPEVLDQSGQLAGFPVTYDMQRQTIRGALPNGTYTLRARSFNGKTQRLGQVSFTVSEKPLSALNITLLPMATIAVVVRRDFAEPAQAEPAAEPNGSITAQLQSPPSMGGAPQFRSDEASQPERTVVRQPPISLYLSAVDGSGSQGNFQPVPDSQEGAWQLDGVAPGRYWVQAQGVQGYIASITADGVDLTREPLVVGPGGASSPIEVTLRNDTATLKVTLAAPEDPSSSERTTAYVYVIPQFDFAGPISQLMVTRQAAGQADATIGPTPMSVLGGLAPGTYRVYAFATPHDLEYRNSDAMQPYAAQSQTVTLAAHDTTSIEVKLPSPAE